MLGPPKISIDPCKEALEDTVSWQNDEAGLTGDLAEDLGLHPATWAPPLPPVLISPRQCLRFTRPIVTFEADCGDEQSLVRLLLRKYVLHSCPYFRPGSVGCTKHS